MADDEVRWTIRLGRGLTDVFTFQDVMGVQGVQVVSFRDVRTRAGARDGQEQAAHRRGVDRDPAAPRRTCRPFVFVLQGAEPAFEAAMARFRQLSDARGHTVEVVVLKLPPDSL